MKQPTERMNQFIHPRDGTPMTSDEIMGVIVKQLREGDKYASDIVGAFAMGLQVGIMVADLKYMEAKLRKAGFDL